MGPALCLVSAALFGTLPIFGRLAYAEGVSPGALLLVRFLLAAVLLGMLLIARPSLRRNTPGGGSSSGRTASSDWTIMVALGLGAIGYAAQSGLYLSALQRMDASLVALILYTYPVLVTVAGVLLGRDRFSGGRTVALAAGCGGIALVVVGAGGVHLQPVGAVLAFGSAAVYTSYILTSDTVVHRLAPVVLAALVMTGAAATLGARALLTGVDLDFGWRGWFWLACIAVVSTVLAMLAFFAGLRRTGPSTTAILSTLEPIVTVVLAALTLGESLTLVQVIGGVLVLSAAAIVQLRGGSRAKPSAIASYTGSPVATPPTYAPRTAPSQAD
jgi:drug/metabolite transporter (DMT)-like permease